MKKIISVSRRTDIPAFYGDWFMNRIREGFAGHINPFGGQKYVVSLKPDDVECLVFWSKNYLPFIDKLNILQEIGYLFYFNYTITGLPKLFEYNLVDSRLAINSLIDLSKMFTPEHINWRYDPIVISDATDYRFHVENFANIAAKLAGHVKRCYFSFAIHYGKVKRNCDALKVQHNVTIVDQENDYKISLANELAEIATKYGIILYTCSGDFLINDKILKAHCIDINIIKQLLHCNSSYVEKSTRKECGCVESTDIGAYDTCPHGCVYCYANVNKNRAKHVFDSHDFKAAYLGCSKEQSDKWLSEISQKNKDKLVKKNYKQLSMF